MLVIAYAMAAGVARERLAIKFRNRRLKASSDSASRPFRNALALDTESIPGTAEANKEIASA